MIVIIFLIIFSAYVCIKDLQDKRRLEEQKVLKELELDCSELCNYSLTSCSERLKSSFEKHGYAVLWDEKCPNIQEEIKCFNNCNCLE